MQNVFYKIQLCDLLYSEKDKNYFDIQPRIVKERGKIRLEFTPGISQKSKTRIATELKKMDFHRWVPLPISKIGEMLKLKICGWLNYYGKFRMSEMRQVFWLLHLRLVKWIRNKYRRYRKQRWGNAYKYLQQLARSYFPKILELEVVPISQHIECISLQLPYL